MNRAVGFLQSASSAAIGAHMLRNMDAQSALLPISSLPDDDQHTANYALLCLVNVMGNQEAAKGEDSPIMIMRPDIVGVGNEQEHSHRFAILYNTFACCSVGRL